MILKNKFLILLVVIIMTLTSCDGFRKAVTGGSKKPKGDEFLVIKKELWEIFLNSTGTKFHKRKRKTCK